jgi:uncharacterized Zn finger protein (UPF0148 family)
MRNKICPHCGSPLMKIDHYGEVLIGCVHCNYWGRPGKLGGWERSLPNPHRC